MPHRVSLPTVFAATTGSGIRTSPAGPSAEPAAAPRVIGRLPGQTSCLTVVWAVLDRASRGWRGLTMTSGGLRLLHDLIRSLLDGPVDSGRAPSPRPGTASVPTTSVPPSDVAINPEPRPSVFSAYSAQARQAGVTALE